MHSCLHFLCVTKIASHQLDYNIIVVTLLPKYIRESSITGQVTNTEQI